MHVQYLGHAPIARVVLEASARPLSVKSKCPALTFWAAAARSRDAKLLSTGWHSAPRDTAQEPTQERTQIGVDRLGETFARRTRALQTRD